MVTSQGRLVVNEALQSKSNGTCQLKLKRKAVVSSTPTPSCSSSTTTTTTTSSSTILFGSVSLRADKRRRPGTLKKTVSFEDGQNKKVE